MVADLLTGFMDSPWLLPVLFGLVFLDALLVVIPGELAVSAAGALAASVGSPPLLAVIAVAAAAAFCGDLCCYLLGRAVGLGRWRWMQHPRVAAAFDWAGKRLDRGAATVVFTARFIPFARLAVNLTAGATRVPAVRYLSVVGAAGVLWACYQAVVGAAIGALLPGQPILAIVLSIVAALAIGVAIDLVVARRRRVTPR